MTDTGRFEHLIGARSHRLTVKGVSLGPGSHRRVLECVCDCGQEKLVTKQHFTSGFVKSCGCLRREHCSTMRSGPPRRRDIAGQRFGRLTAIEPLPRGGKRTEWRCKCECGNETTAYMSKLVDGRWVSCGCYRREDAAARAKVNLAGRKGSDHPLWNPDLSEDDRARRRLSEIRLWSKAVLLRDGFRCVSCGTNRGPLNAHHLRSYRKHPELRLDLNNGATVCVPCHRGYHKLFGRSTDFTPESFHDFCRRAA